mmetsp:Transcript_66801/g.168676  ORF Transcript_66801/g.168676 Transcript_66801/m.168676 type:complete len:688 (-) Transcript_66801:126-2189(-)
MAGEVLEGGGQRARRSALVAAATAVEVHSTSTGLATFHSGSDLDAAVSSAWVAPWDVAATPSPGAQDVALLPFWDETDERPEHRSIVLAFHTEPCSDFQNGYCTFHRPKGKTSPCFCYHFETQRRRPPIDASLGRLLYWDLPCVSMTTGALCPEGDDCMLAHSHEEISYHPAKYKTRHCNGRGCRGEGICCFAHSEDELRGWAPERYSYWALITGHAATQAALGVAGQNWMPHSVNGASLDVVSDRHSSNPTALSRSLSVSIKPMPSSQRHKQRFCASFPDVGQCRRGSACAFAHSRDEARTPLLTLEQEQQEPSALTEHFFMYQFKTLWCPIGVQHDWQTCVYAHNYQDARRQVSIGYGPRPCPYWAKKDIVAEYSQRCPMGLHCPFSHGAKEQLYHPHYFRTVICRDLRAKACPRQKLCAFFHRRVERRRPPVDSTDYSVALPQEALPESWVKDFLAPPFRDASSPAPNDCVADLPGSGKSNDGANAEGHPGNIVDGEAYWCAVAATLGLGASAALGTHAEEEEEDSDYSGLSPEILNDMLPEDSSVAEYFARLSTLLPFTSTKANTCKLDGEGTPRTQTGESDLADDSSSESKPNLLMRCEMASVALARRGTLSAGAVGTALPQLSRVSPGSSDDTSNRDLDVPWKVQAPSYGPFNGPFGAFPGFLATSQIPKSQSLDIHPMLL